MLNFKDFDQRFPKPSAEFDRLEQEQYNVGVAADFFRSAMTQAFQERKNIHRIDAHDHVGFGTRVEFDCNKDRIIYNVCLSDVTLVPQVAKRLREGTDWDEVKISQIGYDNKSNRWYVRVAYIKKK